MRNASASRTRLELTASNHWKQRVLWRQAHRFDWLVAPRVRGVFRNCLPRRRGKLRDPRRQRLGQM